MSQLEIDTSEVKASIEAELTEDQIYQDVYKALRRIRRIVRLQRKEVRQQHDLDRDTGNGSSSSFVASRPAEGAEVLPKPPLRLGQCWLKLVYGGTKS